MNADQIFQHGLSYYGVIYVDLGCTPARLFAVDIDGGGRASLNAFYVWEPNNEPSKQAVLARWERNKGTL